MFRKFSWKNLLVFAITLIISLIAVEWAYRKMLFGESESFAGWRKASMYAIDSEDNYWKLQYLFTKTGPPEACHPLLGWNTPNIWHKPLIHKDYGELNGRRPVLLYGDSFAECVGGSTCFQYILNADTAFSDRYYFLNYGTGGYGTDQIYMLMDRTAWRHERPFVVYSLLTTDMDRSILKVRSGPKPWFELVGDSLALKGVPLERDPVRFYEQNPPEITSYLWNRFVSYKNLKYNDFGELNEPELEAPFTEKKKRLNEAILNAALKELRAMNTDFVFLIFHYNGSWMQDTPPANWRDEFLKDWLARNHVPHIWSDDLLRRDRQQSGKTFDDYIIHGNGHPTTAYNQIICEEIKTRVALSDSANPLPGVRFIDNFEDHIRNIEHRIVRDAAWWEGICAKKPDSLSDAEFLRNNALYMLEGGE